ncbi:MAG: ArnT family glycosyltransferase [Planctomycetota bacterium JB042]
MNDARPAGAGPALVTLLALVAALLALRLAILFLAFDTLFTPGYELFPMGVLGNEIRLGLPSLPVLEFHDTHSGGQMLSSALTAVAFALFGTSYLALKLVPVLFAVGTLVVLFWFVWRRFGLGAATFSGLALVLGPASYVDYSTSNYGNHSEVLFFVALSLFPLHAYLIEGRRTLGQAFLFGLTCGLAVWYALSSLIVVVLYLGFWFCVEGAFFLRRNFVAWLAGAAVGTAPLSAVMLLYEAPQAKWMEAKFAGRGVDLAAAPGRWAEFFTDLMPRSATFYDLGPISGATLNHVLFGLWVAVTAIVLFRSAGSFGWCFVRVFRPGAGRTPETRDLAVVFLLYPLALAGAYAFSNFKIGNWKAFEWAGFRYVFTGFLFLNLTGVMAYVGLERAGRRTLAHLLAAAFVGVGLLGNLGHGFSLEKFGEGLHYPGYYYAQTGRIFRLPRYQDEPERVVELVRPIEPRLRRDVLRGAGIYTTLAAMRKVPFVVEDVFRSYPAEARPFVAQGAGSQAAQNALDPFAYTIPGQKPRDVKAMARRGVDQAFRSEHPDAVWLIHGLFLPPELVGPFGSRRKVTQNLELLQMAPPGRRRAAAQGLGMHAGELLWRGVGEEVAIVTDQLVPLFLSPARARDRGPFLIGLGYACDRYFEDPDRYEEALAAAVPAAHRTAVYIGIGWMAEHVLRLGPEVLGELPSTVGPDARRALESGLRWQSRRDEFVGSTR